MNTLYLIQLNHTLYRTTDPAEAWGFCLQFDAVVIEKETVNFTIDSIQS